jgi:muramoyltetrapeptide carboxypeptidase
LVGGNLSLLAAACGTRHQPDTRGAILFLEDVAEPPYRIDRMLTQLRLAGLFDGVVAVALGEFISTSAREPRDEEGGVRLAEVFADLLRPLRVPVALGLPFGHGEENWTLPLGVTARLDATAGTLELLGAATSVPGRNP